MIVTSVSGSSSTPYTCEYRTAIASRNAGNPRNGGYPWALGSFAAAASASITCWGGPTSGFPRPRSTSGSPSSAACSETFARSAVKYCCGSRSSRWGGGRMARSYDAGATFPRYKLQIVRRATNLGAPVARTKEDR